MWLAAHLPGWVTPDFCTGTGIIGAMVIMSGYMLSRISPEFLWIASLGFIINWFGDSLDGTLARYRNIERHKYGYFVDHAVDVLNEMLILVGLGLSLYVRLDLACLVLCLYLMLSILVFLRTFTNREFNVSFNRLGPTEMRIGLILLNTIMYFGGLRIITVSHSVFGQITFSLYDPVIALSILVMLFIFISTMIRESIFLAKTDLPEYPERRINRGNGG